VLKSYVPKISEFRWVLSPQLYRVFRNLFLQAYHWGYLHNYACIVLTRLVREFYAHLEVVQNDDNGITLQSTIVGHVILVDPQVIS
jgi:hypothetical protein